jgi:excisionase family DNA binding protein
MAQIEPDGMNIKEAAAYVGLSRNTFLKFLRRGIVPHRRLDTKTVLFSRTALTAWMAGQGPAEPPAPSDGQPVAPPAIGVRRPFARVPGKIEFGARTADGR